MTIERTVERRPSFGNPLRAYQLDAAGQEMIGERRDELGVHLNRPCPLADGEAGVGAVVRAEEQFGPVGVILSLLSGLGLIFFAISGLYMYIQMYRRRAHRHSHPRRLFW